jgi:hypothetical protein
LATKYSTDVTEQDVNPGNATVAHVAEPATRVTVTFAAGLTVNDQHLALRALADYALRDGETASTATS